MPKDFDFEAENPVTGQKASGIMGMGGQVVGYTLGFFLLIVSGSLALYGWARTKAVAGVESGPSLELGD